MDKHLKNYFKLIIPQPLEENEYIRLLFGTTNQNTDKTFHFPKFVKTFEEAEELINKYKFFCNCFLSLSTYKKDSEFEDKYIQYRRQAIFVDFDYKDYPHFKDVKDFSSHFKKHLPWLHNHCIVASGSGGYHFYIATETTNDIVGITNINKTIVRLTKADSHASSITQIARIPTTYNLKDIKNKKAVKTVVNCIGSDNFRPYKIQMLESRLQFEELNRQIIPEQEPSRPTDNITVKYYCVDNMLNSGCKKGERNFALGRITAKLKKENFQKSKAKEMVLDWNKRCSPPKSEQEVKDDFERYWNNDNYKLLGCNLPEGRQKEILKNYCGKALCRNFQNYEMENDTKDVVLINESFFSTIIPIHINFIFFSRQIFIFCLKIT